MEDRGLRLSKQYGQNFLIDPAARKKIIDELELDSSMQIWEVGAGIGSMTWDLLVSGADILAFEIDRGFSSLLKEFFHSYRRVKIIEGDVLKTWIQARETYRPPDRIFGNLPYTIGSLFIARIIHGSFLPPRMVFMLQKEVAQRITADEGSKLFASFSLLCQLDYHPMIVRDIPRESFFPRPDVTSSIVRFDRKRELPLQGEARKVFLILIRELFASRRKTLRNNIRQGALQRTCSAEAILQEFSRLGISAERRAETIPLEAVVEASRGIAGMDNIY